MIHIKWILLTVIVVAWAWICRTDFKEGGYLTGLGAAFATLVAIILLLVWWIIFF